MTPRQLVAEIEGVGEAFVKFVEALSPEELTRRDGDNSWSVAQLSGHVAEYAPFWAERAKNVLANPEVRFGRTHDNEDRMAAIPSLVNAQPDVIASAVRDAFSECLQTLRALPTVAWSTRVQRLNGEEVSMLEVIEAMLLTHTRDHLEQARVTSGANVT